MGANCSPELEFWLELSYFLGVGKKAPTGCERFGARQKELIFYSRAAASLRLLFVGFLVGKTFF